MAYGARLESVLGASPRGFESPILRASTTEEPLTCRNTAGQGLSCPHLDTHGARHPVQGGSSPPSSTVERRYAPPPVVPSYSPIWLPSVSMNVAHQLVGLISVLGISARPPSAATLASMSSMESTST